MNKGVLGAAVEADRATLRGMGVMKAFDDTTRHVDAVARITVLAIIVKVVVVG